MPKITTLISDHDVLKEPKASHAVLLVAAQAVRWSLRLVFVLIVARVLGARGMGTYALIYAIVEILAVATGSGYMDFLTREAAKDPRAGWGLAFQLVGLRLALAIPVTLIGICVLPLLHYPHRVLLYTAWMALTIVPRSLSEAVQGVLRGIHQYNGYFAVESTLGMGLVAGGAVLALKHGSLEAAIGVEVLAAAGGAITACVFAAKLRTRERIFLSSIHLLKRSGVFNLYGVIANAYDRIDVVLLSKLAGDYATGIYSVAYRGVAMAQFMGYGILYSLLPTLSKDVADRIGQARLARATGLLLSAGYFIVLMTIVLAGPAVHLILGYQYSESGHVLKILVWVVGIRYFNASLNTVLLAAGRERVFVRTMLVCLGVNLIGNLALIPRFGWRAAAVMTIVTELTLLAQNIYWVSNAIGHIVWPWAAIRTSAAFGILLILTLIAGHLGFPILGGMICAACYVIYLYRCGIIREFVAIWGSRSLIQHGFVDEAKLDVSVVGGKS